MDSGGDPSESTPLISEDACDDRVRGRNSRSTSGSTSANGNAHRGLNGYGSQCSVENGTAGIDDKSMDRITLTWKNVNAYLVPQTSTAQKCRSCFIRSGETPSMRQILKNGKNPCVYLRWYVNQPLAKRKVGPSKRLRLTRMFFFRLQPLPQIASMNASVQIFEFHFHSSVPIIFCSYLKPSTLLHIWFCAMCIMGQK